MSDDERFFTPISFGFRKRGDELAERREQKLHEDVGYEWSAVQAYAREFAAEHLYKLADGLESDPLPDQYRYLTADELREHGDTLLAENRGESW